MARRLVEAGVPFVEVDFGGWDNHANIFPTLQNQKLPALDKAISALVTDLDQRGLLQDTAIIWMGEFSRTPRINGSAGRDHWARSWSVVVGGAGMKGGIAVGKTNADGTEVETEPYTSQDVMATVCKALGISLETTFTSKQRPPDEDRQRRQGDQGTVRLRTTASTLKRACLSPRRFATRLFLYTLLRQRLDDDFRNMPLGETECSCTPCMTRLFYSPVSLGNTS